MCSYLIIGAFISDREIQKFIKNRNITGNENFEEKIVGDKFENIVLENKKILYILLDANCVFL
jgi:hypothetical protein